MAENPSELIQLSEKKYHAHINSLAERICADPGVKIILLAGPSGSGKTTTANLLSDAIKALGKDATVVSLDDFYKDAADPTYPRTKDKERDYECPEALHLDEVADTLSLIERGRSFFLPKYDFKVAARVSMKRYEPKEGSIVIIEGLHALNPKISGSLSQGTAIKLFVSVSTNVNDGEERIISGRKLRFVRRMVRDSLYRGASAERTLGMWDGVLRAEDKYLYPYKASADVAFDTFHEFEPSVMTHFAKRLLVGDVVKKSTYARTVLSALERITKIDPRLVPENSLIKEFIPGGIYEELY
jgi:uridine kinase